MAFLRRLTPNGFPMDEVYSALQKGHRRNLSPLIMSCLKEMEGFPGAMKKRLMSFVCEDVPYLPVALECLRVSDKDVP